MNNSGNFLIYGSLVGIKILNIVTNRVVRVLGGMETGDRFLSLALYQGTPKVSLCQISHNTIQIPRQIHLLAVHQESTQAIPIHHSSYPHNALIYISHTDITDP